MCKITARTWYADNIKGNQGVVAEIVARQLNDKAITHDWFRRCCRRNGVSSIETKVWLYSELITWSRTFPLELINKPEFHTYQQWQLRGFQVMKDEQAFYINHLGDPVFHNLQVVEK